MTSFVKNLLNTKTTSLKIIKYTKNVIKLKSDVLQLNQIGLEVYSELLLTNLTLNDEENRQEIILSLNFLRNIFSSKEDPIIEENLLNIFALTILNENRRDSKKFCSEYLNSMSLDENITENKMKAVSVIIDCLMEMDDNCLLEVFPVEQQLFLTKLFFNESNFIKVKSFECVKLVLRCDGASKLLKNIWEDLNRWSPDKKIIILCSLVDYFIPFITGDDQLNIFKKDDFWELVQSMLRSDGDRKSSIWILKRTVDIFSTENIDFKSEKLIFVWEKKSPKELIESWRCFFTILENLDEKQSHLILPSFGLIKKINLLDESWRLTLLQVVLKHENSLVLAWGVNYVIENFNDLGKLKTDFLVTFLEALNNTFLYSDDKIKTQHFDLFFKNIISSVLVSMESVDWRPVPFYHTFQSLIKGVFNYEDLELFFTRIVVLASNVQNTFIRSALQTSFLQFLNCKQDQFKSIKKLSQIIEGITKISENDIWESFDLTISVRSDELDKLFEEKFPEKILANILKSLIKNNNTNLQEVRKFLFNKPLLKAYLNNNSEEFIDKRFDIYRKFNSIKEIDYEILILEENLKINSSNEITIKLNTTAAELFCSNDFLLKYFGVKILKIISGIDKVYDLAEIQESHKKLLENLILEEIFTKITIPELSENRGLIYATFYNSLSVIRMNYIKINFIDNYEKLISDSLLYIDLGGHGILSSVMECLQIALKTRLNETNSDLVDEKIVVERCFKEISSLRHSDDFWECFSCFINMILTGNLTNSTWNKEIIEKFFNKFLEKASQTSGMANLLFVKLLKISEDQLIEWEGFIEILKTGLLFGDVPKRDQRIEAELCREITKNQPNVQKTRYDFDSDIKIRGMCYSFLFKVQKLSSSKSKQFFNKLIDELINEFNKITKSKPRYFADSQHHRIKLRIVQTLSILFDFTNSWNDFLLNTILNGNNQPNVNYIIECITARTISSENLIKVLENLNDLKMNPLQSIFVVTFFKCCQNMDFDLASKAIEAILPWTMGQHFSTRLYAQITVLKFIEKFNFINCDKYSIIYKSIKNSLKQGNAEKNSEKLLQDFRFNSIDFQNLTSICNIFYNIPRITLMAPEELIPLVLLKNCANDIEFQLEIKEDFSLNNSEHSWNKKQDLSIITEIQENDFDNVQKKIIPGKFSLPDFSSLMLENQLCKKTVNEGIIVVASLVSRFPNLGGLARTCEIFGVQEYVIDSLKHMENKEFQALSVSAEKWLRVSEVKSWELVDYLTLMKTKGYCIVGAEQTSNSVQISEVKFPKKTILLLGHEKEGVPANLISMLDITAEIPQFGIIRSLNVHVTGSLFMWEYAKQHFLQK